MFKSPEGVPFSGKVKIAKSPISQGEKDSSGDLPVSHRDTGRLEMFGSLPRQILDRW